MSEESKSGERIKLGGGPVYDTDLLGGSASKASGGYVASIATGGDLEEDDDEMDTSAMPQLGVRTRSSIFSAKSDIFFIN